MFPSPKSVNELVNAVEHAAAKEAVTSLISYGGPNRFDVLKT